MVAYMVPDDRIPTQTPTLLPTLAKKLTLRSSNGAMAEWVVFTQGAEQSGAKYKVTVPEFCAVTAKMTVDLGAKVELKWTMVVEWVG